MNTQQVAPEAVAESPLLLERPQQPHQTDRGEPIPEINGPKGPEPTRFGDWERKGRCVDF